MFKKLNKFVKTNNTPKNFKVLSKRNLSATILLMATALFINTASAHSTEPSIDTKHIDQLEWVKGADGLYFALSWGDWTKPGDYGMIVKIEAGVVLPRHSHTYDYHGMTIQGNWVHSYEKGDERLLPSGSYAFQKGKEDHGDRCEGTQDCLILIHQHGPRDFFPEK